MTVVRGKYNTAPTLPGLRPGATRPGRSRMNNFDKADSHHRRSRLRKSQPMLSRLSIAAAWLLHLLPLPVLALLGNALGVVIYALARRRRRIVLDACTADADCKKGSRCECDREAPNYCLPSNCDSDAECSGLACADAPSGRYCRTKNDQCARDADCPPKDRFIERCDYDLGASAWRCVDVEPPPPG